MANKNERSRNSKIFTVFAATLAGLLFLFQDCSPVSFQSTVVPVSAQAAGPVQPNYSSVAVGQETNIPPLKLIFVVDNSATMLANQINLGNSFSRLFDGQNATNISKFDTSVYMINTSQMSVDRSSSVFSILPTQSLAQLQSANEAQLVSQHRGNFIDGFIPGDLVGYQVQMNSLAEATSSTPALSQIGFSPSPVLALSDNGSGGTNVSYGFHKGANDSVDALKADFNSRIALMNPIRSAIDPVTNQGVLDAVVNNESGLCALARVMRHNDQFVKPGDLAAFILVSDEDDNDPTGSTCIDSYNDVLGTTSYVDGQCSQPWTNLSYQAKIANPSTPKCQVAYDSGFNYQYTYNQPQTNINYYTSSQTYEMPQTKISYVTAVQTYQAPRTDISYYTSSQSYDTPESVVSYYTSHQEYDSPYTNIGYFTSAQAYDLATTDISYYTSAQVCQDRDGAQINCVTQFTQTKDVGVLGDSSMTSCSSLAAANLPAGALLSDPAHPVSCAAGVSKHTTGACSTSDKTKLNCTTTYTAAAVSPAVAGNYLVAGCSAFAAKSLPVNAVLGDLAHPVTCSSAPSVHQTGACSTTDTSILNCKTVYAQSSLAPTVGDYTKSASCQAYAAATGKLPANAISNDSSHAISCASGTPVHVIGVCSTSDTTKINCATAYTKVSLINQAGDYTQSASCQAYATGKISSAAIVGDSAHPVLCAAAAAGPLNVTGACSTTNPSELNCTTTYPISTKTVVGDFTVKGCAAFVVGNIPSTALTDAAHAPTCAAAANAKYTGACSTTDTTKLNCTTSYQTASLSNVSGDYTAVGCANFASGKLTNAVANDTNHPITCALGTPLAKSGSGSETYSGNSLWATYNPTAGAACSKDLLSYISTSKSIPVPATCQITTLQTGNYTYDNTTCAVADPLAYCTDSSGARRDCVAMDIAAGAPYASATTTDKVKGTISCDTLCSDTSFCQTLPGTVGANYHNCSVQAASPTVDHTFTGVDVTSTAQTCATGLTKIVTNGPYKTKGEAIDYVAGTNSANRETNGLALYLQSRIHDVLSDSLAISTNFVMQRSMGDKLGQAESYGDSYNAFADLIGGVKNSVLTPDYSSALQNLSSVIHERIDRSFSVPGYQTGQKVYQVWHRASGSTDWGQPLTQDVWTSAGGTVSILPSFDFEVGDEFQFEYY